MCISCDALKALRPEASTGELNHDEAAALDQLLIDGLFMLAAASVRQTIESTNALEIDGSRAKAIRQTFRSAMADMVHAKFRCEHVSGPRPVLGRASNPGYINCGACAELDIMRLGGKPITCDTCDNTTRETMSVVVVNGPIMILTAICAECALAEGREMFDAIASENERDQTT